MKKHRRHYPSYVTNAVIRDHIAEQSQPRKAQLTPFSYVLITFAAVLMMTGLFSMVNTVRPQATAAAQAPASAQSAETSR